MILVVIELNGSYIAKTGEQPRDSKRKAVGLGKE